VVALVPMDLLAPLAPLARKAPKAPLVLLVLLALTPQLLHRPARNVTMTPA
jgi:hypothetical protein